MKKERKNKFYYAADLKVWEWDSTVNEIKESYKEFTKEFTDKELKDYLEIEKFAILGFAIIGMVCGCIGFFLGGVITGLISMLISSVLFTVLSSLFYWINNCKNDLKLHLGEQDGFMEDERLKFIFSEEIAKNYENKLKQEELAFKWRKKHPLEEKIRLALTGNPNDIAELLKYCDLVKSSKKLEQ